MMDAFGNDLPPEDAEELDEAAVIAVEREKHERADRLRDLDRVKSIAYTLATPEGRHFVWDLLAKADVFAGAFDANPYKAAFNEGRRQFGAGIFHLIDHDTFYLMQCEHRDREARYHVTPPEKETSDV